MEELQQISKEEKETSVKVKKSDLQALLDRIDRLEYAASKASLDIYDKKRRQPQGKEAVVTTYEGKFVVGWRMNYDVVQKNPNSGVWSEDQRLRLAFLGENELSEEIPYATFTRRYQKVKVRVKKEIKDENGNTIWEVETMEGEPKKFTIDTKFVN